MLWDNPVFEKIVVHPAALGLIQRLGMGRNAPPVRKAGFVALAPPNPTDS